MQQLRQRLPSWSSEGDLLLNVFEEFWSNLILSIQNWIFVQGNEDFKYIEISEDVSSYDALELTILHHFALVSLFAMQLDLFGLLSGFCPHYTQNCLGGVLRKICLLQGMTATLFKPTILYN